MDTACTITFRLVLDTLSKPVIKLYFDYRADAIFCLQAGLKLLSKPQAGNTNVGN